MLAWGPYDAPCSAHDLYTSIVRLPPRSVWPAPSRRTLCDTDRVCGPRKVSHTAQRCVTVAPPAVSHCTVLGSSPGVAPLYSLLVHLVGLVVKASASGVEDPGFESHLRRDFSGSGHTSDFKVGTPAATLPDAWHYRVSPGTGRPCVRILWVR